MYRAFSRFMLSVILVSVIGCAPGMGNSVNYPNVPTPAVADISDLFVGRLRVIIGEVNDARTDQTAVVIDGRKVPAPPDCTESLTLTLERAATAMGLDVRQEGAPTINLDVMEWRGVVKPEFPLSTIETTASIKVSIVSESGRRWYSAVYTGTTSSSDPFLDDKGIVKHLAEAMEQALSEVFKDVVFVEYLGRAQPIL